MRIIANVITTLHLLLQITVGIMTLHQTNTGPELFLNGCKLCRDVKDFDET